MDWSHTTTFLLFPGQSGLVALTPTDQLKAGWLDINEQNFDMLYGRGHHLTGTTTLPQRGHSFLAGSRADVQIANQPTVLPSLGSALYLIVIDAVIIIVIIFVYS